MNHWILPGLKYRLTTMDLSGSNTTETVIMEVIRLTRQAKSDVLSKKRNIKIVYSRHLIRYFLRVHFNYKLLEASKAVYPEGYNGKIDHTNTIYSVEYIRNALSIKDERITADVEYLKKRFYL